MNETYQRHFLLSDRLSYSQKFPTHVERLNDTCVLSQSTVRTTVVHGPLRDRTLPGKEGPDRGP